MPIPEQQNIAGSRGTIAVHEWTREDPSFVVLLAHGYGEHARRYDHVADALVEAGGAVYAPDHRGHGRSDGEMALVDDIEELVADLFAVSARAREAHHGLPVVLIGHSMGGIVATRYAQSHEDELTALVLSGPAIGGNPGFEALLGMDPIPEIPIDPAALSRDPAVGEAYASDDLVYHGPFKRETLLAFFAAIEKIKAAEPLALPVLWIHGSEDQLAPVEVTRPVVEQIAGGELEEHVYDGAQHEIFNETNKDEVIGHVLAFLGRTVGDATTA